VREHAAATFAERADRAIIAGVVAMKLESKYREKIFVPGRQDFATRINPACGSADLFGLVATTSCLLVELLPISQEAIR